MANWLTAPEAGRLLGVAPFSLHRMARRGEVRFQRLGRLWVFDRREIARLRRTRRAMNRAATSEAVCRSRPRTASVVGGSRRRRPWEAA